MLHGALGDEFDAELLSYEAPTYFGMLTASYSRSSSGAGQAGTFASLPAPSSLRRKD